MTDSTAPLSHDLPYASDPPTTRSHPLYGIALSLTLHALVIASLLGWQAPPATDKTPLMARVQLLELLPHQSGILLAPVIDSPDCLPGKLYLGIGMQFDEDRVVITAPNYYPAYQAGIRPGDVILNPALEPDREGYDHVELSRHGKHLHLRVRAQWICLQ